MINYFSSLIKIYVLCFIGLFFQYPLLAQGYLACVNNQILYNQSLEYKGKQETYTILVQWYTTIKKAKVEITSSKGKSYKITYMTHDNFSKTIVNIPSGINEKDFREIIEMIDKYKQSNKINSGFEWIMTYNTSEKFFIDYRFALHKQNINFVPYKEWNSSQLLSNRSQLFSFYRQNQKITVSKSSYGVFISNENKEYAWIYINHLCIDWRDYYRRFYKVKENVNIKEERYLIIEDSYNNKSILYDLESNKMLISKKYKIDVIGKFLILYTLKEAQSYNWIPFPNFYNPISSYTIHHIYDTNEIFK